MVARKGFRHPALGVCNINIEISFMAIGQNGMCTEITNHLCCCGKGHGRHNDSLPGLETDGFQCQVKRGGARVHCHANVLPYVSGEFSLEPFRHRPGR